LIFFNVKDVFRAFLEVWRGINELCKLDYDSFVIETINYLMYFFDATMVFMLPIKVDAKAPTILGGMHGMDKWDDWHVWIAMKTTNIKNTNELMFKKFLLHWALVL
jgi:hypothetical protein